MAFDNTDASVSGLLRAGVGVLVRQLPVLLAMAAVAAVSQIIQHAESAGRFGGAAGAALVTIAVMVLNFVVQLMLLRQVLARESLMADDVPLRFWTYIGVEIVFGLAVGFASVLLLVPGILLFLRWYNAGLFVLARGTGVSESFNASRDSTSGHRLAIFGTMLLLGIVFMVPAAALFFAAGGIQAYAALAWTSPIGLATLALGILFTPVYIALHVGIFGTLAGNAARFEDVFA